MAWTFADSFDLYAAIGDAINGYWDSGVTIANITLASPGRFTGSQMLQFSNGTGQPALIKSSGVNDAVHHIALSFRQTAAITGSTIAMFLELFDGATGQCSVCFRSDGAILLTSGGPAGTVLATYTGAFPVTNTWYAFEIEVVINNTTGSIAVRKNGNTVNDFFLGSLNTRTSANNYANKLQLGYFNTMAATNCDDLFWRSDASSVAWLGDIRCYTRMPAADSSVQWTGVGFRTQTLAPVSAMGAVANRVFYSAFTLTGGGSVTSVSVIWNSTTYTGNVKCAIYTDTAGSPATVIASATNIITPVTNVTYTFTFAAGATVTAGQKIWVALCIDSGTGGIVLLGSTPATHWFGSTTYASFPVANPTSLTASNGAPLTITVAPTSNAGFVADPQQDAGTTYVYSSTNGQADLYTIAAIAGGQPVTTLAVTTRGYAQKDDAGTRNLGMQLKSGATVSPGSGSSTALNANSWQWVSRTDLVDPATGAAWTAGAVASLLVGPVVTA